MVRTVFLLMCIVPGALWAMSFDGSWKEQGYALLFANTYEQHGDFVTVESAGTASLLWRPVPAEHWAASQASWTWTVTQSVPPTDLGIKGLDDKNFSLFFVFTSADVATDLNPNRARRVLQHPDTHALAYVWGGANARGDTLRSPYHPRMQLVVLRPSGTGSFTEAVDLTADYNAAFGTDPPVLIGVGLSADSDDTNSIMRGRLSHLELR